MHYFGDSSLEAMVIPTDFYNILTYLERSSALPNIKYNCVVLGLLFRQMFWLSVYAVKYTYS